MSHHALGTTRHGPDESKYDRAATAERGRSQLSTHLDCRGLWRRLPAPGGNASKRRLGFSVDAPQVADDPVAHAPDHDCLPNAA